MRPAILSVLLSMTACKTVVVNCPAQVQREPVRWIQPIAGERGAPSFIAAPRATTAECTPEKCPDFHWQGLQFRDVGMHVGGGDSQTLEISQ